VFTNRRRQRHQLPLALDRRSAHAYEARGRLLQAADQTVALQSCESGADKLQ
jgi:hypothetical protein